MIPYLSTEMILQSLWRRGQQQWRDGCCCSHGRLVAATTRTFFCEHWRVTRASLRASFACLYVIRRVHSNGVRRARARNKICTFVHNTYERMLIQNSRTCRPAPTQHTTQHNSSTPTTMSKGTHLTMNPDNIQKNYGKGGTTRASRNNPQNRNGGTLYHPHRL